MNNRRGIALLEVLVALAIFGACALTITGWLIASGSSTMHAQRQESDLLEASAFLDHVVLWSSEELDRRTGTHPQGRWLLEIDRRLTLLYEVALIDSATKRVVLSTSVYKRPESQQ